MPSESCDDNSKVITTLAKVAVLTYCCTIYKVLSVLVVLIALGVLSQ